MPRPLAPEPKAKERILLVDDSRVMRKVFATFLSLRFECLEAASYLEAVTALRRYDFDVVVTDIIMPGLSGIELVKKVAEDYPNTQIIVASGVDRSQRALDAMRLGAFDYLIKPCEPAILELTIDRALEHRRLLLNAEHYKQELEKQNAELKKSNSDRERLQVQIIQSSKMASLGQLAAGVAHELNNPVGFVHANLEILDQLVQDLVRVAESLDGINLSDAKRAEVATVKEEVGFPGMLEEINSIIGDCREGTERIRSISQNLRTFSRLDEAEYKVTDIHEGLEATIRLASQYLRSGKIALIRDYCDLPMIEVFAGQLNQVWMNLIVNAVQAIGAESGEIRISTRFDEDNIWVEISDNGCGIAVQNLDLIFNPFFTTKPVGEGTGLGLSISYGIIDRHGGSIDATSDLGKGTTFNVRLPRDFKPDEIADEKSIECYSGK